MYACIECGRKFKSEKAAEKAADDGCPNCGGVDIDLEVTSDLSKGYQEQPLPKYDHIGRPIEEENEL
jgi:predicted  nucleic acid-binding Zn-ribbon protein